MHALRRDQRQYWQGWNAALEHVLTIFDEAPDNLPLGDEGERLLAALRFVVGESLQDRDRIQARTNDKLAKRFGCSKRTIQYWRTLGAPLDDRLQYMLDWLATRRSLPRGTAQKFRERLERRGWGSSDGAAIRRGLLQAQTALVLAKGRL